MKRFLRWLLDFVERKFPDKVVLTPAQMQELMANAERFSRDLQNLQITMRTLSGEVEALRNGGDQMREVEKKILEFQAEINKFNFAMGFAQTQGRPGQAPSVLER